ncbi:hypothetical protein EO238_33490, partial [Citrobacter sp. AAK_AS5]
MTDAFGTHVETKWTDYVEVLWITENNEVMEIQGIGQLNRDDIRFVAPYNTAIVIESKIVYNNRTYTVLSIDRPDESVI